MRALVAMAFLVACNEDASPPAPTATDLALPVGAPDLAPPPGTRRAQVRFTPTVGDLQIAVWIEDAQGRYIDTLFVTRATGFYGLGNRPGSALFKSGLGWPEGRREMVLPVWAHRRNHHYPKLVMGGTCMGKRVNSQASMCGDNTLCGVDCDDDNIAYHSRVSSYEPYYCTPSGASQIDVLSCASRGGFPKGAFADPPAFSLYPPRADVPAPCNVVADCPSSPYFPRCIGGRCLYATDAPEVSTMATLDDLVAVSAATPSAAAPTTAVWTPAASIPDGDYVAWIELSEESDFNASNNHPCDPGDAPQWAFEGHCFLGQPSVVYRVPFHLGADATFSTVSYAGYGSWDGSDGDLRPPDATISDDPGTGAGRLAASGGARVTVSVAR